MSYPALIRDQPGHYTPVFFDSLKSYFDPNLNNCFIYKENNPPLDPERFLKKYKKFIELILTKDIPTISFLLFNDRFSLTFVSKLVEKVYTNELKPLHLGMIVAGVDDIPCLPYTDRLFRYSSSSNDFIIPPKEDFESELNIHKNEMRHHYISDNTLYIEDIVYNVLLSNIMKYHYCSLEFYNRTNDCYINEESLREHYRLDKVKDITYSSGDRGFKVILKEEVFDCSSTIDRKEYHTIKEYNFDITKRTPFKLKLSKENTSLYLGVELEVSTDYYAADIVESTSEFFCIVKEDSSVTGTKRNQCEIVTLPASLKSHKKYWAELFRNLAYEKFDTSNSTNNGCHIHIEKNHFFNDTHLTNFCWFFSNPSNNKVIKYLSERESYKVLFNKNNILSSSMVYQYCKFPFEEYSERNLIFYKDTLRRIRSLGKNCIINLVKKGTSTIEIRLFRGMASYTSIIKNLELVQAVYYFSINKSYKTNTLESFLLFLEDTPKNQYRILKETIEFLQLDEIIEQEKLNIKLSSLNSEEEILKFLHDECSLEMRQNFIKQINNSEINPFFIIQNKKGLTIIKTSHGLLHRRDEEFSSERMSHDQESRRVPLNVFNRT